MSVPRAATVEDSRQLPAWQKAELVGGRLVLMSPTGHAYGNAVMRIAASLMRHAEETGTGEALGDNRTSWAGFIPH